MFENYIELWNDKGFEICIGLTVAVILILALFRIGKKGSWTSKQFFKYVNPNYSIFNNKPLKAQPKPKRDSSGEIETKRACESIFNKPFSKIRPDFLKNPVTKENLEIDCYNDELKIGVEYNGRQHYEFIPFFHKTKETFRNQQYRDELKRRMCKNNGIFLIEIPYTVKVDDIESYIRNAIQRN